MINLLSNEFNPPGVAAIASWFFASLSTKGAFHLVILGIEWNHLCKGDRRKVSITYEQNRKNPETVLAKLKKCQGRDGGLVANVYNRLSCSS